MKTGVFNPSLHMYIPLDLIWWVYTFKHCRITHDSKIIDFPDILKTSLRKRKMTHLLRKGCFPLHRLRPRRPSRRAVLKLEGSGSRQSGVNQTVCGCSFDYLQSDLFQKAEAVSGGPEGYDKSTTLVHFLELFLLQNPGSLCPRCCWS